MGAERMWWWRWILTQFVAALQKKKPVDIAPFPVRHKPLLASIAETMKFGPAKTPETVVPQAFPPAASILLAFFELCLHYRCHTNAVKASGFEVDLFFKKVM